MTRRRYVFESLYRNYKVCLSAPPFDPLVWAKFRDGLWVTTSKKRAGYMRRALGFTNRSVWERRVK